MDIIPTIVLLKRTQNIIYILRIPSTVYLFFRLWITHGLYLFKMCKTHREKWHTHVDTLLILRMTQHLCVEDGMCRCVWQELKTAFQFKIFVLSSWVLNVSVLVRLHNIHERFTKKRPTLTLWRRLTVSKGLK